MPRIKWVTNWEEETMKAENAAFMKLRIFSFIRKGRKPVLVPKYENQLSN